MLIEKIKLDMKEYGIRHGREVKSGCIINPAYQTIVNVLGLVIADSERIMPKPPDETVFKVIKKIIAGNEETLQSLPKDDSRVLPLIYESKALTNYLPQELSREEIFSQLTDNTVVSGNNKGQEIGKAVKYLKSKGLTADGKLVQEVVAEILDSTNA